MRVKCVNVVGRDNELTLGQFYHTLDVWRKQGNLPGQVEVWVYHIINDVGIPGTYSTKRFKSLSEIRDERLNSIL